MSATLRIWDSWELLGGVKGDEGGSRSKPIELTVDGLIEHKVIQLATSTTITLWDSSESITNFDFLWFQADQDLYCEVTADRGAEVGTVVFGFIVESNTPFRLIYDDALANFTANFATGTADVIDRIRLRNVSGTTANIEYCLIS